MNGSLPLARKLIGSSVWEQGPLAVQLWIWMLMTAVFAEEGYTLKNGRHLKRGQLWTTYRLISKALKYRWGKGYKDAPIATLKRIIDGWLVERLVELSVEHTGITVTICNYEKYNSPVSIGGTVDGTIEKSLVEQEEKGIEEKGSNKGGSKRVHEASPEAVACLSESWERFSPLPATANRNECLKVLDDLCRLDGLTWDRIARICSHAAQEWVPQGFIGSPATLRGWTKKRDMKTWEKIERQAKGVNGNGHTATRPRPPIMPARAW